jgi:histidinol-phosphate aminotransferase
VAAAERALPGSNRYPDERVDVLQKALSECYGGGHFLIGAGMDGIIETLIRTLVEPGEAVAISMPTFSYYGLAALAQEANIVSVPRDPKDFSKMTFLPLGPNVTFTASAKIFTPRNIELRAS